MRLSDALKKLPRSQLGWAGDGKAMLARQAELAATQGWEPAQHDYLESVKRALIGNASATPKKLNEFDGAAVCRWDCYRRMTMLEPLVADVFRSQVPGDFIEAGVFTGGVSTFLTALLCAKGALGEGEGMRRMWMADSFAGMPPDDASARVGKSAEGFTAGTLIGTVDTVTTNLARRYTGVPATRSRRAARSASACAAAAVAAAAAAVPACLPARTFLAAGST